jgi:phosphoenolpyruvate-protein phosphotransferase (PTS system enzyme I)
MASDPRYALLLVGMGLRRLSLAPRGIPEVKSWLRDASAAELSELADRCLAHSTAADVTRHLENFFECTVAARN